jgi:hypothetical protein
LLGKIDMFVLGKLFDGLIEHGTQRVSCVCLHWASPIVGWSRCAWTESIATHFALLVLLLAMAVHSSLAWVMLLSRNRLSLLRSRCSVYLMCWRQEIFCCLRCSRGPGGMMVLSLSICCVRVSVSQWLGVSSWESMANALCTLGLGLEIFSFTVTCYHNPFVIIVLSVLRHPRAPSMIS